MKEVAGAVALVVAAVFIVFVINHLPCSTYKFTPNKDVPARCLKEFNK